jgi:DNA-binding XRE family transcriptional regulator
MRRNHIRGLPPKRCLKRLGALPSWHLTLKAHRPKLSVRRRGFPMPLVGSLGYRICQLRTSLALLQAEVAKRLGVTVCTVRNWERGRSYPLKKVEPKLVQLLGDEALFAYPFDASY